MHLAPSCVQDACCTRFKNLLSNAPVQVDCSHPQLSPKRSGSVLSVACGSHTHFFAAPSPAEARAWVEAITAAWVQVSPPPSHCAPSTHGRNCCDRGGGRLSPRLIHTSQARPHCEQCSSAKNDADPELVTASVWVAVRQAHGPWHTFTDGRGDAGAARGAPGGAGRGAAPVGGRGGAGTAARVHCRLAGSGDS